MERNSNHIYRPFIIFIIFFILLVWNVIKTAIGDSDKTTPQTTEVTGYYNPMADEVLCPVQLYAEY
jgi:ABC-type methionine transport system permease subunit